MAVQGEDASAERKPSRRPDPCFSGVDWRCSLLTALATATALEAASAAAQPPSAGAVTVASPLSGHPERLDVEVLLQLPHVLVHSLPLATGCLTLQSLAADLIEEPVLVVLRGLEGALGLGISGLRHFRSLGCELLRHLLEVQLLVVLLKVVVILEFLLRRGALVRLEILTSVSACPAVSGLRLRSAGLLHHLPVCLRPTVVAAIPVVSVALPALAVIIPITVTASRIIAVLAIIAFTVTVTVTVVVSVVPIPVPVVPTVLLVTAPASAAASTAATATIPLWLTPGAGWGRSLPRIQHSGVLLGHLGLVLVEHSQIFDVTSAEDDKLIGRRAGGNLGAILATLGPKHPHIPQSDCILLRIDAVQVALISDL